MGNKQEVRSHSTKITDRLNHYPAMISEEDPLHESTGRRDANSLIREIDDSLRRFGSAMLISKNFIGLRISQAVARQVLKRGAMVTIIDGKDLPKQSHPNTEDEKRGLAGAMFFKQV